MQISDMTATTTTALNDFIERIEKMQDEKDAVSAVIKEVFAEAKSSGFDPKAMREVLRKRKMDKDAKEELEALEDLYQQALGMR